MQIIRGTIKLYAQNARKIDYIFKRAYNDNVDIRCVGAGISDDGSSYILVLASEELFAFIDDYKKKRIESKY